MTKKRLSDLLIQKLKVSHRPQETFFDDALPGFGVRVSKRGTKVFVVMYGKERKLETLGRYPDLSLAEARKRAKERLGAVVRLPDTQHISIAFPEARERFLEDARLRTRPSTYTEYKRLLHKHFTFTKSLDAITRADIMAVIEGLNGSPSTAAHAFMAVKVFMNWTVSRGLLQASPMPRMRFKQPSRARILTDTELKAMWQHATLVGYPYGTIVQLLVLTGQRRGEIAALRRSWITDEAITFPSSITKNKREHRIPLGDLTKQIIAAVPGDGDLLFPARGKPETPMSNWAKRKRVFDKSLILPSYTLHDLRRTFASKLARLGTPVHVTEKLLNHVSGTISGVAATYQRYSFWDEMTERVAMHDLFASQCFGVAQANAVTN